MPEKNGFTIFGYRIEADTVLAGSLCFYLLLTICLLPFYQYQNTSDGISYISIAQKYIDGNFSEAINGYWGPLFSWLISLFLLAGLTPFIAAKVVIFAAGAIAVYQANRLIRMLDISSFVRVIVLNTIVIITTHFAFTLVSPDLLLLALALTYLAVILEPGYSERKYAGLICGLIGAALYLTKNYGFPFFFTHFIVINLILAKRTKAKAIRTRVLTHMVSGLALFALISLPWILLLSSKYGHFSLGTAGRYNHAILGPDAKGHPFYYRGLFIPSNDSATSVWEDPSGLDVEDWNVFNSRKALKHQVELILHNLNMATDIINDFSSLSLVILAATIIYLIERGRRVLDDQIFLLVLTAIILFSGYLMILVVSRYVWLCSILMAIIGAKLLDILLRNFSLKSWSKILLINVFATSFLLVPTREIYSNLNTGSYIPAISRQISDLNIKGRIASNRKWAESLFLAFANGWQYYGIKGELNESELKKQLEQNGIDYFLFWIPDVEMAFLHDHEELTKGKIPNLKIYRLSR